MLVLAAAVWIGGLAATYRWDGPLAADAVVAAGLVAATVAGVIQPGG